MPSVFACSKPHRRHRQQPLRQHAKHQLAVDGDRHGEFRVVENRIFVVAVAIGAVGGQLERVRPRRALFVFGALDGSCAYSKTNRSPKVLGIEPIDDGNCRIQAGDVNVANHRLGVGAHDLRRTQAVNAARAEVEIEPADGRVNVRNTPLVLSLPVTSSSVIVCDASTSGCAKLGMREPDERENDIGQGDPIAPGLARLAPTVFPRIAEFVAKPLFEDLRTDLGVGPVEHVAVEDVLQLDAELDRIERDVREFLGFFDVVATVWQQHAVDICAAIG
jgi:hypothetical protein